jgi:ABC-type branched-subunit amino acid transport system ATPase component
MAEPLLAPLLATAGLTKRFGGLVAASEVALAVLPGEIHAIIGPNGAGKTTLISLLAGELRPDAGTCRPIASPGLGLASCPKGGRFSPI